MTTRRDFLKLLAGTALAPFVPAIAAMPENEAVERTLMEILQSGEPLYLGLGSEDLEYKEFPRQEVRFDEHGWQAEQVSFPTSTISATVTHLYLSDANGGFLLPIRLTNMVVLSPGITPIVHDVSVTYE
jgi:hypothetical protein